MEKQVGGAFLRQILTDKDEAYVIDFNVDVFWCRTTRATFTACKLRSTKSRSIPASQPVQSPVPEVPLPTANSPGTVLYDAVYLYCPPAGQGSWP